MLTAGLGPEDFRGTERFHVQRRLGAGGSGVVYRAFDRERDAVVALKALRRTEPEALYRFKREFRSLTDLTHANLISLYELLCEEDQWFFTMELVEGVSFSDYVRAEPGDGTGLETTTPTVPLPVVREPEADRPFRPLPTSPFHLGRLRSALGQLAEGLCSLHDGGMLHRDLKPSNVLVSRDGRLVLLDFGLVSELGARARSSGAVVLGTPSYVSPEQVEGRPLTEASDWFSVGVMLYATLTGGLPFSGRSFEDVAAGWRSGPRDPAELVPGLPDDIASLCRALLSHDPQGRPSGRDVLRRLKGADDDSVRIALAPPPAPREAFVGRQSHLEDLEAAFRATRGGSPVVVYVDGESGMGKTALVSRFLDDLRRRERVVVLEGRCYERESVPYKALDSLVDALSHYLKLLSPVEAEGLMPRDVMALSRLFPVLRRVEAVAGARRRTADVPDLQELRRRAFGALRELLTRLADREAVVLFVDDLQWGDEESAALLAELLRPPDPPALLLIAAYRSEDATVSPFLRALLPASAWPGGSDVRWVSVEELAPSEALELAVKLVGEDSPASRARAEVLARESSGSPFLLGELARHAPEAGTAEGSAAGITLEEVLRARLSRLPPEALRLLEVVAVAGQPVGAEAAGRAARLDRRSFEAARLLRSAHLVRTRGAHDNGEIETYHDRIRAAVLAGLSPATLKQHHRCLAGALEVSGDRALETLAVHFEAGGDPERAADYAARAAAQAFEALAFERAARLYRWTLDLAGPGAAEERGFRVRLAEALANAGRGAQAAEAYLAAAEGGPAAEQLDLRRRAAEQLLISGHFDRGLEVLRAVLGSIGMKLAPTPGRALASLLLRRAHVRLRGLRFRERDATQVSAEELIRIDTCWSAAKGLGLVDTIRGADFQARHLLLALGAGEPYRVARALALEVGYRATAGTRAQARTERLIRTAAALAERVDNPHAQAFVTLTTALAAWCVGDWLRSRVLFEQAEHTLRERCTGVAWELTMAHIFHLLSLYFLGELREFTGRLPRLLKEARDRGDLFVATSMRTRVAYVAALAADRPDRARQEVREAMRPWSRESFHLQRLWELFAEVETDLYAGDGIEAWRRIGEAWPGLVRSRLLRVQNARIWSLYHRARSALAAAAAGGPARTLLRAGALDARRIEQEKAAWAAPLARLIHAGIAMARGETESALRHLTDAEATLDSVHMALFAAAARRHRGELLGESGRELVDGVDAWMRKQRVRNPARMAAMLAPRGRA